MFLFNSFSLAFGRHVDFSLGKKDWGKTGQDERRKIGGGGKTLLIALFFLKMWYFLLLFTNIEFHSYLSK